MAVQWRRNDVQHPLPNFIPMIEPETVPFLDELSRRLEHQHPLRLHHAFRIANGIVGGQASEACGFCRAVDDRTSRIRDSIGRASRSRTALELSQTTIRRLHSPTTADLFFGSGPDQDSVQTEFRFASWVAQVDVDFS
jgi:hypothetical protein